MATKSKEKKPSIFKIVCKLLLALFLVYLLLDFMIFMIAGVGEETVYYGNLADQVDSCNRYYYEKDYAELRDYLLLYNAYDEAFDIYWEMVDGYSDYMQYKQWLATPDHRVSGSSEMVAYYKQKIVDNAKNCRFEQNFMQLQSYADMISE